MPERLVVALGGNAILLRGEKGTAEEQRHHVRVAVAHIIPLIAAGHELVITHGNGPQVGDILLKEECARDHLPRMPLDICDAETQGMIGYMIQQELENALRANGISRRVLTIVTQALVDPGDPAFGNPTKPIGPFYTEEEARTLGRDKGWVVREEQGQGFRRVVPSPFPVGIVETDSIRTLFEEGFVVIAAGGGGVPVVRGPGGELRGIEAVIDKDRSAYRLAVDIGAGTLLILTDVPAAYRGFGTSSATPIGTITADEAERLLRAGEFGPGSMAPKVDSCIRFVRSGGRAGLITSLPFAEAAVAGSAGTRIVPGDD
jgi:carbamate kinase